MTQPNSCHSYPTDFLSVRNQQKEYYNTTEYDTTVYYKKAVWLPRKRMMRLSSGLK